MLRNAWLQAKAPAESCLGKINSVFISPNEWFITTVSALAQIATMGIAGKLSSKTTDGRCER